MSSLEGHSTHLEGDFSYLLCFTNVEARELGSGPVLAGTMPVLTMAVPIQSFWMRASCI